MKIKDLKKANPKSYDKLVKALNKNRATPIKKVARNPKLNKRELEQFILNQIRPNEN